MAFSETQISTLKAKLKRKHVKTRAHTGGRIVSYIEGWHVIAEANRIFGFDNWSRQTLTPQCFWSKEVRGQFTCFYQTKVCITVRAGQDVIVREGIGTGYACDPSPEAAHELALKAAETDATKRALATFGNVFGLALYDREQAHVTKLQKAAKSPPLTVYVLSRNDKSKVRYTQPSDFIAAAQREIDRLETIDGLYDFWTANLATLALLSGNNSGDAAAETFLQHIKQRLRDLVPKLEPTGASHLSTGAPSNAAIAIPKEKRIRDPQHLAFVRTQPCLVCGRRPAHAHHLRFAQPRGMGLKVSDEFTLPLCNVHHDELHRTADERAWWARYGIIEPLKYADRLWAASREKVRSSGVIDVTPSAPAADDRARNDRPGDEGEERPSQMSE